MLLIIRAVVKSRDELKGEFSKDGQKVNALGEVLSNGNSDGGIRIISRVTLANEDALWSCDPSLLVPCVLLLLIAVKISLYNSWIHSKIEDST